MSAIFGALYPSAQRLDPTLGARMDEALAARPADASRSVNLGPCVLGARASWYTPESQGQLPPFIAEDGIACLADIRLDRRDLLSDELGVSGALSDEALVVLAYRRWGARFAAHLLGDFALALWDPHARRLLLARDPYGVRALYYAHAREAFVFASQARALFVQGAHYRRVSPLRVAQYVARDFGDLEDSFFEGVRRLPPGHSLELLLDAGSASVTRAYFTFDRERELPRQSSSEYAAEFRALFIDAVRERTRSLVPVGCMLSGGLDSSGLLGALRALTPDAETSCFSARFKSFPEIDEGSWLALLKAQGGLSVHELDADQLGPLDDIQALHDALDEPFHAPNLFVYHRLSALARRHGQRVLLDGLDGDSVVEHGFLYLHTLARSGRLRTLGHALSGLRRRTGISYARLLSDYVLSPELDRRLLALSRWGFGGAGYLLPSFRLRSGFDVYRRRKAEQLLATPTTYRAQHHATLTSPIMAFYLEVHDKAAAAHGLDHRHPYFDRRLIEFCLALPPEQRLYDGWDRVIQRRAFADLVPDAIRTRQSKSVWTENFHAQLFGRHGELLGRIVDSDGSPLAKICDLKALRRERKRLSKRPHADGLLDLWCALTLGLWLEQTQSRVG